MMLIGSGMETGPETMRLRAMDGKEGFLLIITSTVIIIMTQCGKYAK